MSADHKIILVLMSLMFVIFISLMLRLRGHHAGQESRTRAGHREAMTPLLMPRRGDPGRSVQVTLDQAMERAITETVNHRIELLTQLPPVRVEWLWSHVRYGMDGSCD